MGTPPGGSATPEGAKVDATPPVVFGPMALSCAAHRANQAQFTHQPRDGAAAGLGSLVAQGPPDLAHAIDAEVGLVHPAISA